MLNDARDDGMAVASAGSFTPRSRQITTPALCHSIFYRTDALPDAQQSTEGKQLSMQLQNKKTVMSELKKSIMSGPKFKQLEMWANAQRDGHPAEYRWRPLFNAAKFG